MDGMMMKHSKYPHNFSSFFCGYPQDKMSQRKISDYKELKKHLKENEDVSDMEIKRRMKGINDYTDLYLRIYANKSGIDLWTLHEEFNVDVVFCWHDPTKDKLDIGLRVQV